MSCQLYIGIYDGELYICGGKADGELSKSINIILIIKNAGQIWDRSNIWV